MILNGALINGAAVLAGGLAGSALKKGIPERLDRTLTQGLGLCVVFVGISGALNGEQVIIAILSMVIGTLFGELINIDRQLTRAGYCLQSRLIRGSSDSTFAESFVSCTIFVCVGAMAIVGSLQSGLSGNHEILYAKSLIDFVSTMVMAAALGPGAALASVPVLLYEAALTLSAGAVSAFLTPPVVNEMTCVGSLIIMAIGFNMLKITDIKVANFLLAPFLPVLLCHFF